VLPVLVGVVVGGGVVVPTVSVTVSVRVTVLGGALTVTVLVVCDDPVAMVTVRVADFAWGALRFSAWAA
jgi:hypothetical protein